jgi:hypothetical protein
MLSGLSSCPAAAVECLRPREPWSNSQYAHRVLHEMTPLFEASLGRQDASTLLPVVRVRVRVGILEATTRTLMSFSMPLPRCPLVGGTPLNGRMSMILRSIAI